MTDARALLVEAYRAALAAVDPERAVAAALQAEPPDPGALHVVAIGKAAAGMAAGARAVVDEAITGGVVVIPDGVDAPNDPRFAVYRADHPVPSERSLAAGDAVRRFVEDAPADAQFLFLVSGGSSSLVECLPPGGDLAGLQALNARLLAEGQPIHVINRIRRAVSLIKGGRLGERLKGRPAQVLLISDVQGDDPAVIGSGPLCPPAEPSVPDDLPADYRGLLPAVPPGPDARDAALSGVSTRIVASNGMALEGAAACLRAHGQPVRVAGDFLAGEAGAEGERVARALADAGPGVTLWGGEPTVRLPPSPGAGGRMQLLALSAARCLAGDDALTLLAAGTDGVDGVGGGAGAVVDGGTLARGVAAGLDAGAALAAADSSPFLEATGDRLPAGPTGTNVMDVVIGCRAPRAGE